MITTVKGTLEYEVSPILSAPHGFTCRRGGVSSGCFSGLNISLHRGDDPENVRKNWNILGSSLGFAPEHTVFSHQTHSDRIRPVTMADARGLDHHLYPECDGLITNTPGVSLCIFTADCTPILLHDPVTGAVGAVHAGWRGTAQNIAGKAVAAMERAFGCQPGNIRAAIGPNIAACCFQTDEDVPQAMAEAFGPEAEKHISSREGKYYVNLKAINALALSRAGVTQIDISDHCTLCRQDRYFSHRAQGINRGSQGAVIVRR